jgi:predicted aspartyl protease
LLALLLILPSRAAEPPWRLAFTSMGAYALIQLAGQPLSGGRSRGSVSLPLERAEGGHTPVLDFQVSGSGALAGSRAAGFPGAARIRLLLDTGATSTMVTPELADRLALERRPLPPGSFGLAGGGQGCAALNPLRTRLPDLELRDATAAPGTAALALVGVEALVLPVRALPAGVDGVLGVPSLRLMPLRIDPHLNRITLGASALDRLPSSSATPPSPRLRLPARASVPTRSPWVA